MNKVKKKPYQIEELFKKQDIDIEKRTKELFWKHMAEEYDKFSYNTVFGITNLAVYPKGESYEDKYTRIMTKRKIRLERIAIRDSLTKTTIKREKFKI